MLDCETPWPYCLTKRRSHKRVLPRLLLWGRVPPHSGGEDWGTMSGEGQHYLHFLFYFHYIFLIYILFLFTLYFYSHPLFIYLSIPQCCLLIFHPSFLFYVPFCFILILCSHSTLYGIYSIFILCCAFTFISSPMLFHWVLFSFTFILLPICISCLSWSLYKFSSPPILFWFHISFIHYLHI